MEARDALLYSSPEGEENEKLVSVGSVLTLRWSRSARKFAIRTRELLACGSFGGASEVGGGTVGFGVEDYEARVDFDFLFGAVVEADGVCLAAEVVARGFVDVDFVGFAVVEGPGCCEAGNAATNHCHFPLGLVGGFAHV